MYPDVTGIILSGGKSSRMGENKSLMVINGKTIIERVRDFMQEIFPEVILITNEPDVYEFLGLKIFEDEFKGFGPLAGIHSGLLHSSTQRNFFISCDVPLMTSQMIKYLVDFKTEKPITIAKADGFIQQLVGIYNRDILVAINETLKSQSELEKRNDDQLKRGCRVLSLVNKVGAEIISADELSFYRADTYFNMNKQSDYNFVKEKLTRLLTN